MPDLRLSNFTGGGSIDSGGYGGYGGFGGSIDWGGLLRQGLDLAGQYLALPGGTDVDLPGYDLGAGDPMSTSMWSQGTGGFRQRGEVVIPSPDGKIGVWKAAGRPVLYSGDLAACKRVNRVAARVGRVARRRSAGGRRRGGR